MYLFFTLFGILFVIGLSVILNNMYNVFPINKITKFLSPNKTTTFNKISVCVLPIIIWSFIELPILGNNYYFILGLVLNIFINCSIMYIIVCGYSLISEENNEIIKILSIIISSIFGFIINYICLLAGDDGKIIFSIIGVLVITLFYIIIKIFPPKSDFFKEDSM